MDKYGNDLWCSTVTVRLPEIKDGVLIKYTGSVTDVTIPDGVTEIGAGAFSGNTNIRSVKMSDKVKNIGNYAFADCYALKNVDFGNVEKIGVGAFRNSAVEEINLPDTLKEIGQNAFGGMRIKKVTIPKKVRRASNAFAGANIRQLYFEEGIVTMPKDLLNQVGLENIYIPRGLYIVDEFDNVSKDTIIHAEYGSSAWNHAWELGIRFFYSELYVDTDCTYDVIDGGAYSDEYLWTSDDEDIATVDGYGDVCPKSEGICHIIARYEDGTEMGSCLINVEVRKMEIYEQPESVEAQVGDTVEFHVYGDKINSYQWYYSQNAGKTWKKSGMTGFDTDTLTVYVTESRIGQMYRCQVTGADGTTIDSEAASIMQKFEITKQPGNVITSVGETVVLSVEATGAKNYQWYYSQNGGASWSKSSMPGSSSDELVISVTAKRIGQKYRCQVTGLNGDVLNSEAATLLEKLEITKQPVSQTAAIGDTVSFEVVANGAKKYQWYYSQNGGKTWSKSSMAGNTSKVLTIPVTATRIGQKYRCYVTGADGKTLVSDSVAIFRAANTKSDIPNIY